MTQQEFIQKAREKHGSKYDYSLVEYINTRNKVKIICPEHGVFEQRSSAHIEGQGCLKCSGKINLTGLDFINKAKIIHGNVYNYTLVEYKNMKTKVKIICPKHGIFHQMPYNHLIGKGCLKCGKNIFSNIDLIEKMHKRHNNRYDYSLLKYTTTNNKIKIYTV